MQADVDEERLWSEFNEITSRTLSKIPERPPKVTQGSFEIVGGLQDRQIYLYWQNLQKEEENGPDFKYVVTQVKEENLVK